MQMRSGYCAVAAALLCGATALSRWDTPAGDLAQPDNIVELDKDSVEGPGQPGKRGWTSDDKKKRQEMSNFADLQYFSDINIGGQQITGIIDTGSFDLVVFDTVCSACGRASKYSSQQSSSFASGKVEQVLNYGSGSVSTREAFDLVSIGPFNHVNLSFWNAYTAYMPVLRNARFQSIIGVGPPETPAADAWTALKSTMRLITGDISEGLLPSAATEGRMGEELTLASELSFTSRLVQANNVSLFSICLGYKPGSAGYFVWDDQSAVEYPQAFSYVPVMGKHTWTVNMSNVALAPRSGFILDISCANGCGAIVDSGTSLLLMPSVAVTKLLSSLQMEPDKWDCNDLSSLPELTFNLGGHQFSLPPDAYIAKLDDEVPARMSRLAVKRQINHCELAVMESYAETNWGPLWILGMPFFRKYYTTFKLGTTHADRGIMVAKATPDCYPDVANEASLAGTRQEAIMRTYNVSNMFLSQNVLKAQNEKFLRL